MNLIIEINKEDLINWTTDLICETLNEVHKGFLIMEGEGEFIYMSIKDNLDFAVASNLNLLINHLHKLACNIINTSYYKYNYRHIQTKIISDDPYKEIECPKEEVEELDEMIETLYTFYQEKIVRKINIDSLLRSAEIKYI